MLCLFFLYLNSTIFIFSMERPRVEVKENKIATKETSACYYHVENALEFFSSFLSLSCWPFFEPTHHHQRVREFHKRNEKKKKTIHITEKLAIHQIAVCKLVNPASGTSLTGFACERLRAQPLQPASPSKRDFDSYLLLFLHHCCCLNLFLSPFIRP